MTVPPLARAVAKALAEEPLDIAPPANAAGAARRDRTIAAIRAELLLREKRRARRRWATVAAAAAALLLASGVGWLVSAKIGTNVAGNVPSATPHGTEAIVAEEVHGAVFLVSGNGGAGGTAPLGAHVEIGEDQSVVTEEGDVTLALGTGGTRVKIDPRSNAALKNTAGAGVVRMKSGAVTAMVAKLKPNERFLVQTDEAEVEAHGTVFTVARTTTAECGARTSVHVVEGRISVRDKGGTLFLNAADDWKSKCAVDAPPTPSTTPSATTAMAPINPPPRPTAAPTLTAPTTTSTTTVTTAPTETIAAPPATSSPYPEFGRRK